MRLAGSLDRSFTNITVQEALTRAERNSAELIQSVQLKAFEEALEYITGHSDVWVTTGREIASHFLDTQYDTALANIASKQGAC